MESTPELGMGRQILCQAEDTEAFGVADAQCMKSGVTMKVTRYALGSPKQRR